MHKVTVYRLDNDELPLITATISDKEEALTAYKILSNGFSNHLVKLQDSDYNELRANRQANRKDIDLELLDD